MRGTCDRVRTWSGFYSIMPDFHSRVRSFLDFNCDAIVDLWIFIISLTHRTRYFVMSIEMSVCKFTCIMDETVGGMWSFSENETLFLLLILHLPVITVVLVFPGLHANIVFMISYICCIKCIYCCA